MEKLNFVILIRDDSRWEQLFSHTANMKKQPDEIDKIAVVAISTALLSCLKSTHLDSLKANILHLTEENVDFYMCTNTLSRYGINEDLLLPEIKIAREGGLIKVARFETIGYHTITLG